VGLRRRQRTPRAAAAAAAAMRPRELGFWAFVAIAFQLTAGGPSGTELSVLYAGPLPTFVGLLVLPLVWGLPQALVVSELAVNWPQNGGPVVWAHAAFGDVGAWAVGLNSAVSALADLALYPLLFADSLAQVLGGGLSAPARRAAAWALVAAGLALNVRGLSVVSRASSVVAVAVLTPYLVAFLVQLPQLHAGGYAWAQVREPHEPHRRLDLWLASMLWAFSGYDAAGSLAGEIRAPERTLLPGLLVTMAAASLSYGIPLFTAIQTHPAFRGWTSGVLQAFAGDVHPLLGAGAAVASLASQLGMFTAGLSASARAVWALAGGCEPPAPVGGAGGRWGGGGGGGGVALPPVAHLPRALAAEWRGVPLASLVGHAVCVCLLVLLPFEALLPVNLLLGSVRVVIIAAAFLRLRAMPASGAHKRGGGGGGAAAVATQAQQLHAAGGAGGASAGDAAGGRGGGGGPYRLPGGWPVALLVAAPLLGVSAWFVAIAQPSSVAPAVAVNVLGAAVFVGRVVADRLAYGVWWPRGRGNLAYGSAPKLRDSCADDGDVGAAHEEAADGGGGGGGGGGGAAAAPHSLLGGGLAASTGGAAAAAASAASPLSRLLPLGGGSSRERLPLLWGGAGGGDTTPPRAGGGDGALDQLIGGGGGGGGGSGARDDGSGGGGRSGDRDGSSSGAGYLVDAGLTSPRSDSMGALGRVTRDASGGGGAPPPSPLGVPLADLPPRGGVKERLGKSGTHRS
jgi:amino acid transporter